MFRGQLFKLCDWRLRFHFLPARTTWDTKFRRGMGASAALCAYCTETLHCLEGETAFGLAVLGDLRVSLAPSVRLSVGSYSICTLCQRSCYCGSEQRALLSQSTRELSSLPPEFLGRTMSAYRSLPTCGILPTQEAIDRFLLAADL